MTRSDSASMMEKVSVTGKVQLNPNFLPAPLCQRGWRCSAHLEAELWLCAQPCPRGLELVTHLYNNISPTSALQPFPGKLLCCCLGTQHTCKPEAPQKL